MQAVWEKLKAIRRLLLAVLASRAPPLPLPGIRRESAVPLCSSTVHLAQARFREGGLRYLNLHENESTSVQAALGVLEVFPGQLIALHAGGRRLVVFRDGWRPYAFDPNRIFTEAGMRRTLQRHASDTAAARNAVAALRDAVLALLEGHPDEPVVALHNNRAGPYSVKSYAPGGEHARDAQALAIGAGKAQEDFFLVTRQALFDGLRDAGFNVVLQSPAPADDGSLSVHFQRTGRSYVNVEARLGHLDEQRRMLEAVAGLAQADRGVADDARQGATEIAP